MSSCRPFSKPDERWGEVRRTVEALSRRDRVPDFEALAPCAQVGIDAGFDPWFPTSGCDDLTPAAKRICLDCPIQADCLQLALDGEVAFGIWGGLTATERQHLRTADQ